MGRVYAFAFVLSDYQVILLGLFPLSQFLQLFAVSLDFYMISVKFKNTQQENNKQHPFATLKK